MAQSNYFGKLADRASIIKSTFSELDKAIIKATKHNTKAPKEKHVRRLVVFVHDQKTRTGEIIDLLAKRLEIPDWLVVMKTLATFHRLIRECKSHFIAELRYRTVIFNLRRFADMTTPEAHHQSIFIRKYSQYLEEKVLVYKILNVEFDKDPDVVRSYSTEELFERLPRLQSQMNALLNCRASKDHINNNLIAYSFTLLLKDSFKLYSGLNQGIILMLESYFSMPIQSAQKALDIYRLFTKETDGINQLFEISRRFSKSELPELQHAPTTLVEALENYVKDLESGKNPNPNTNLEEKRQVAALAQKGNFMQEKINDFKFVEEENIFGDADFVDPNTFQGFGGVAAGNRNQPVPQQNSNSYYGAQPATQSVTPAPVTATPAPAPAVKPFDPFGDNFFDPEPVATGNSSNPFGANPTPTPAPANTTGLTNAFGVFDPFGASPGASNVAPNAIPYDAKKKQIEFLMTTGPAVAHNEKPMAHTATLASSPPANHNPWASGGDLWGAPMNNNPMGGNMGGMGAMGGMGSPPMGQNNTMGGMGSPPMGQNNAMGGMGANSMGSPFGGNPFGGAPVAPVPVQNTTNTNTTGQFNPFFGNNDNPFA